MNDALPSHRELDKHDLAILVQLQKDARLTNADLADRVGLSPAPCWRRVRRLEQEGFILGYHAELNRRKIGLGVVAFVRLVLDRSDKASNQALFEQLLALPQVLSAHLVSEHMALELMVTCTDLDAYAQFVSQQLLGLPQVCDVHSRFSLDQVKSSHELPLEHLN